MIKSAFVLFISLLGLVAVASIKHVPLTNMWGASALAANLFGLMMAWVATGNKRALLAFRGKDPIAGDTLCVGLMFAAIFGSIQGLMVLFNNLQNSDVIGPAFSATLITPLYSSIGIAWLKIVNSKGSSAQTSSQESHDNNASFEPNVKDLKRVS